MKNYLVIILSFALCLSLAACNAVDNGENIDGAQVIENTEGNTEKENSSMNTSIVYSPTHSTDRVLVSFDFLERRIALSMSEDRGYAMCLVTVVDIDLDDISDSVGVRIPLTLRIDKVISSNTSFDIAQGESILTADYSLWSQTGEDYSVCYADGVIPITERGAQYIVILTEEGSFDDISDKVELCALPQAIYNTYRRILPKKKDAVVMPEEDALASTQEDKDLFDGMLNFEYDEEA